MNRKTLYYLIASAIIISYAFSGCVRPEEKSLHKFTEYKFDFEQFEELPSGSFPFSNKYFTPAFPARDFIPTWLFSRYFSGAEGSTAEVNYDFINYDRPDYIEKFSMPLRKLDFTDYAVLWGDVYADFLTPDVAPERIPEILAANDEAENGEIRIVQYNYSSESAVVQPDRTVTYFSENFANIKEARWAEFDYPGWYNGELTGIGLKWRVMLNGTVKFPGGYSRGRSSSDSWLVNRNPINLKTALHPVLSFNYEIGYFDPNIPEECFDCVSLYVADSFDGSPQNSNWKDVSEDAGIRSVRTYTGYPDISGWPDANRISLDISEFAGRNFHMGFNYYLPARQTSYGAAPLYYVGNIKVSELRDVASALATKPVYEMFEYKNGTWTKMTGSYYVLQHEDYQDIGANYLSLLDSTTALTAFLQQKFASASENEKKIVVFAVSIDTMGANEFVFTGGKWNYVGGEKRQMVDKYVFSEKEGWQYSSTKNKNQ